MRRTRMMLAPAASGKHDDRPPRPNAKQPPGAPGWLFLIPDP